MERANEIDWLRWFYRNADIGLTEEHRIELERRFLVEEGLRLPLEYETD